MTLKIKKTNDNTYLASFASNELDISKDSENWNIEGINKFLIKLATKTPKGEQIEIECDKDSLENDKILSHIYELFNEFVKQYNQLNAE